ncbi:MAG: diheme cytochrome c [Polynucleobacter sp.]|nr:diheme cytochrome c [Polynucleobacter sp.]MDZ4057972.1 diheme cytochrome c [Polynucleobacter sp.]
MKDFISMLVLTALTYLVIAIASRVVLAEGSIRIPTERSPSYQTECGSCHLAYPPGLLPAQSWSTIMSSLSKHYGADASLDPKDTQAISAWLTQYAGTYKRVAEAPPENRITQSYWFKKKHRKVKAGDFGKPSVKSAANCNACHRQAEQGNFDDDDVQIPR